MSESDQLAQLAKLKEQLNKFANVLGKDIHEIKQQLSSNQDLPQKVKQILNKGYYDE